MAEEFDRHFVGMQLSRLSGHRGWNYLSPESMAEIVEALLFSAENTEHCTRAINHMLRQLRAENPFPMPEDFREACRQTRADRPWQPNAPGVIGCADCLRNKHDSSTPDSAKTPPFSLPPVAGYLVWVGRDGNKYAKRCRCNPDNGGSDAAK